MESPHAVAKVCATEFNNPKTKNYFTNAKGNLIHFHYGYSNTKPAEAVCYFVHGYGGHTNGPVVQTMTKYLNEHKIAVFCMDFQGHGYSTGDRAYMTSYVDLTADLTQFVDLVLSDEEIVMLNDSVHSSNTDTGSSTTQAPDRHSPAVPADMAHFEFDNTKGYSKEWLLGIRTLPFFMLGQSMGGALLSVCANTIMDKYPDSFLGIAMLAPALTIGKPHWLVIEAMRYTVALLNSKGEMPSQKANNTLDFRNSVKDPSKIAMFEADTWGNPGALGYNRPMRWGTALFFLDLNTHAVKSFSSMRFPFLILHDPEDKVCGVQGSRDMTRLAATALEDKKLVEIPDGLHGLLTNDNDMILNHVLDWVQPRIARVRVNAAKSDIATHR